MTEDWLETAQREVPFAHYYVTRDGRILPSDYMGGPAVQAVLAAAQTLPGVEPTLQRAYDENIGGLKDILDRAAKSPVVHRRRTRRPGGPPAAEIADRYAAAEFRRSLYRDLAAGATPSGVIRDPAALDHWEDRAGLNRAAYRVFDESRWD